MASNNPLQINVTLTLHELNQILKVLKDTRTASDYNVERQDFVSTEHWTNPDTGKYEPKLDDDGEPIRSIYRWTVEGAEEALTRRQELSDLIYRLSGEVIVEETSVLSRVAQARVDFDAQEAAKEEV